MTASDLVFTLLMIGLGAAALVLNSMLNRLLDNKDWKK